MAFIDFREWAIRSELFFVTALVGLAIRDWAFGASRHTTETEALTVI